MAKVSEVNFSPVFAAEGFFNLMVWLRDSMGFTVAISGDGLAAFNGAGVSVITMAGSGAGGMDQNNAHFTMQDPAGEYEWCFQRNTDVSWEVIVSPLDGFTGGTATVRPTATDEYQLWNTTIVPSNGTYRWHFVGDTTPVGSTVAVYPWRAFTTTHGSGQPRTLIAHEPLDPGTYPELVGTRAVPTTGEPDPSIYIASYDVLGDNFRIGTLIDGWQNDTSSPLKGYWCMNGVNGQTQALTRWYACYQYSNTSQADIHVPAFPAVNDGVGVDDRDSSDPTFSIFLGRQTRHGTNLGPKGFLGTIRAPGVGRNYPTTMDIAGERYVYCNNILIPYENGTVPLT